MILPSHTHHPPPPRVSGDRRTEPAINGPSHFQSNPVWVGGGGESRAMHKQEAGGFQEKFSSPCPLASQLNPTWIQNRVFTADSVLSGSKTTDVFSRCCWFQLHVIPPRRCFFHHSAQSECPLRFRSLAWLQPSTRVHCSGSPSSSRLSFTRCESERVHILDFGGCAVVCDWTCFSNTEMSFMND